MALHPRTKVPAIPVILLVVLSSTGCGKKAGAIAPPPPPSTRFTASTVDSPGNVGYFASLAIDTAGQPHITYMDLDNHKIKYAMKDSSGWHAEPIGSSDPYDGFSSLCLDASGAPHVTYAGATGLMYATKNGSSWTIETIDGTARESNSYVTNALALDASGNPWVIYLDGHATLRSARKQNGTWTITPVKTLVSYMSFALGPGDVPHIAYGDGDLHYVTMVNGLWTYTTVDTAGDTGYECNLAIDSGGSPYICYWVNGTYDLKLASRAGNTWNSTTVDDGVATRPSLKLDPQNRPCVVYYVGSGIEHLNYAVQNAGTWNIELLAEWANQGSLALDAQGAPRAAFLQVANVDLMYASLTP